MNRWARPARITIISLGIALLIVALLVAAWGYLPFLPTVAEIRASAGRRSSALLDRQGHVLYQIIDDETGIRQPLVLEDVPDYLVQGVIATEDASFYSNPGMDVRGLVRAMWLNVRSGGIVSGGSTITQQVARLLLIRPEQRNEQTLRRKLTELLLAYHLTRTLAKDEILLLYLNEVYMGNLSYGVAAAAQAYFDKPLAQLDLAECALLAGLPQAPSAYNPLHDLEAASARQRVVLGLMVQQGYIDETQATLAAEETLHFAASPMAIRAPHFCMMVREELDRLLGEERVRQGGLVVYTTLDLPLQNAIEGHVARHLSTLNTPEADRPSRHVTNAAALALDPGSGAVRALVGSPDYFEATIDGAVNAALARRQPGSAIKPLTYAAAFERGYSPASVLCDVKTNFVTAESEPYSPQNYDLQYHGPVSLRQALGSSYNMVAVKLLDAIGPDRLTEMARRLGMGSLGSSETNGLALTLGSGETTLIELTAAYAALATGGHRVTPYLIERIEDEQGELLYAAGPARQGQTVLDPRIAYLVTDVLADNAARVPSFGENSVLRLPFASAVKTGTTTDWRDNWTVGYTTDWVVGVWTGNADNTPMEQVSGVDGAAPIWAAAMQSAHTQPAPRFVEPAGLVHLQVCADSGDLPGDACPHRRMELFMPDQVPLTRCAMHRFVQIDVATGRPAAADCPPERQVRRRVTIWPAEARAWAMEQGLIDAVDMQPLAANQPVAQSRGRLYFSSPSPFGQYTISPSLPDTMQQLLVKVEGQALSPDESVRVSVAGHVVAACQQLPCSAFWPLAEGTHRFEAARIDRASQAIFSTTLQISVRN